MSDPATLPAPKSDRRTDDDPLGLRQWLTSLILVGTTMVVGIICIVVLSSTLTQTRLASLAIDGENVSIWKLDYIQREWAGIRAQLHTQSSRMRIIEDLRYKQNEERATAEAKFLGAKSELLSLLEEFNYRARLIDPELTSLIRNQGPNEQFGSIMAAEGKLRAEHPEIAMPLNRIIKSNDAFRNADAQRAAAKGAVDVFDKQIQALQAEQAATEDSLGTVFEKIKKGLGTNSEMKSRVENIFYELQPSGSDQNVGFSTLLITTRPDLLTLCLVILMGVLGSSLQMTNAFFKDRQTEITIGVYFLHLSVGAITALAIFIVAKAGVPVIADASRLGGDAAINPYFVSFLAIVSGLLSENALASIEAQGRKLFGGGSTEPDRWAREDITTFATTDGRSIAELATYLDDSETATTALLKGDEKIAFDKQHIISVYLRRSVRDLFSDIPPAGRADQAAAPTNG